MVLSLSVSVGGSTLGIDKLIQELHGKVTRDAVLLEEQDVLKAMVG